MKLNKHVMAMNLAAVIAFGAVAGIVAPSIVSDDAVVAYAADEVTTGNVTDPNSKGAEVKPDTEDKTAKYSSNGDGSVSYEPSEDTKKATEATIPDTIKVNGQDVPVTVIKEGAFKGSSVKKVKFGANIKTIGTSAFEGAAKLTAVDLSKNKNLEEIGANAFKGTKKCKTYKIYANKLKKVGKNAFKNTNKKAKITLLAKNKNKYNKIVKKFNKKNTGAKALKKVFKKKK